MLGDTEMKYHKPSITRSLKLRQPATLVWTNLMYRTMKMSLESFLKLDGEYDGWADEYGK